MEIWSNTDFPYQCLIDRERTLAFREAILATVRPGDVVLDAGAGTGILSFFAAEAGAAKVYAAEVDDLLASILADSAEANGLGGVVEVVHDDARRVTLPAPADACIMEMIETALIDEMQVPVLNSLRHSGVLDPRTKLIPFRYETYVELGRASTEYYGYTVLAPKHDWPHYRLGQAGWEPSSFEKLTETHLLDSVSFEDHYIDPKVRRRVHPRGERDGIANALKLSSRAYLSPGIILGATNALNGDKVIPIKERHVTAGAPLPIEVSYEMGGGLASLRVSHNLEG